MKKALCVAAAMIMLGLGAGLASAAEPGPLADAIARQIATAPDTIDMQQAPGYLGIPGGPQTNMILAFCWALWVGFSPRSARSAA